MPPDAPGWYLDPKRPGIRRYWDGDHWIDVDQVVEGHAAEAPAPAPAPTSEFRLVRQRRPEDEPEVDVTNEGEPLAD